MARPLRHGAARPWRSPAHGLGDWMDRHIIWFFILPAAIFLLAVVAFPVTYTVWLSFFRWSGSATAPATWVGLANYADVLALDPGFRNALWVTIYFTGVSVTIEVILGVGLAQLLNREFIGKGLARTLLLLPIAGTPVALSLVWRNMYNPSSGIFVWFADLLMLPPQRWIADANMVMPLLILFDVWQWTPLIMLITLAGLVSLPNDLYEAAQIDGASPWQVFWRITIPLVRPTIVAAAMLRLMDSLKTFDQIYVTTQGGPGIASQTLNLYIFEQAFQYLNFGYASALLVVLFFVILSGNLVLVTQRRGQT
ncbi:MAG: carbohydrate ABC transporter permease [Alphaproteobacteria bacterium]